MATSSPFYRRPRNWGILVVVIVAILFCAGSVWFLNNIGTVTFVAVDEASTPSFAELAGIQPTVEPAEEAISYAVFRAMSSEDHLQSVNNGCGVDLGEDDGLYVIMNGNSVVVNDTDGAFEFGCEDGEFYFRPASEEENGEETETAGSTQNFIQTLLDQYRSITPNPSSTPRPSTTPVAGAGVADVREQTSTQSSGNWHITTYDGVTDQMQQWIRSLKPVVTGWSEFPNVDFPAQNFVSANGLEYGMAESAYCQQDQLCDVNTAAMHYRLITGDYNIPGIDQCEAGTSGYGCAIAVFNVGNVTAMFRDSSVDYGFTVTGRYWNGDAMPETIRALASNTVFNMTENDTVNRGANCSIPEGCSGVRFTFVITSGNQVLAKGTTTFPR